MSDAKGHVSAFDRSAWTAEDEKFCLQLDKEMRERSGVRLNNEDTFHAVRLIYSFFLCATKEIRIFSGKLRRFAESEESHHPGMPVYAEERILGAVRAFLADSGTSLKIVIEKRLDVDEGEGPDAHPLVKEVMALKKSGLLGGSCDILQLKKDKVEQLRHKKQLNHMMIADQSMYRVETGGDKASGYASFRSLHEALELISFFDRSLCHDADMLWSSLDAK